MQCPPPSTQPRAHGLPEIAYPLHDREVLVTACGRIWMHCERINIATVLAGQKIGIPENEIGHCRLAENLATSRRPVRPEVVTHLLDTIRNLCLRTGHDLRWRRERPPIGRDLSIAFNGLKLRISMYPSRNPSRGTAQDPR